MYKFAPSVLALLVAVGFAPAQTQAQYPDRPIKLVVGFSPGGNTDVMARIVAQKMSVAMAQPVVVENKTGAGGVIATDFVSKSAPDGYTLLFGTSSYPISASLYKNLPYDPVTAVVPISLVAVVPLVLVVNPKVQATTAKEFVDLVRKSPGKYNYGSAGNGSAVHMAVELLKYQEKLDTVHVPFRGAGPAAPALMAGQVQFMIDAISTTAPNIKSGRLKALAVTTTERSKVFPDLPTMKEAGFPEYTSSIWNMVFAPNGTPADIVARVAKAVKEVMKDPELQQRYIDMGVQMPADTSPAFAAKFVQEERDRWATVVKAGGIVVQ